MRAVRSCAFVVVTAIAIHAAGCAATKPCSQRYVPVGQKNSFLWEVSGPRGGGVVLYGTLHSAGKVDVSPEAWRLLDGAAVFVAEADEVGRFDEYSSRDDWRAAFEAPPGKSLMQTLSSSDFYDLQALLDADSESLAKLKPWVAMGLLMKTVFTFPHPNMAEALLTHAKQRGLATEFFDTWPDQVAFLDATVDAADLSGALHDRRHLRCKLSGQVDAYRWGDDDAFRIDVLPPDDPGPVRVARWTARIAEYVESGRRTFVAVGVGNILGEHGIAGRLVASGYTITRYPGP